jgi:hypothetical protein
LFSDDLFKSTVAAGNMFCGLGQIFMSRAVSEAVGIKIYKTVVKAGVCGSATRTVTVMDMNRLNT